MIMRHLANLSLVRVILIIFNVVSLYKLIKREMGKLPSIKLYGKKLISLCYCFTGNL